MHVYRRKTRSGTSNSGGRRCGDDSARNPDFFTDDARSVSLTVSASSSPSSSRMTSRRRTLRTCSGASSSRFGEEAPLGASATHSSFARPAVRPTRRSARTRPTPRPTRPTSPSGRRLRRRPTPRSSRSPSAAPASSRRSRSSTPRRSKRVCFAASTTSSTIRWTKTWKADGATGDWTLRAGRRGCGSERGFQSFWFVDPGVFAIRASFRRLQDGERGWVSKLHSFGAMDFSRAGTERRFSSSRLFSARRFLSRVARVVLHLPR